MVDSICCERNHNGGIRRKRIIMRAGSKAAETTQTKRRGSSAFYPRYVGLAVMTCTRSMDDMMI